MTKYPTEYAYVPCQTKHPEGPYFAIGFVGWSASGTRDAFRGHEEWRRLYRQGWRIVKVKLVPVKASK